MRVNLRRIANEIHKMGKLSVNNKKQNPYVHQHNYNPKAHESKDRKTASIKQLMVKRLESYVRKTRERLVQYIPDAAPLGQQQRLDPSYELKGAARVAQAYYYPADYVHAVEPANVLATYDGRLWEHAEGQQLLHAMLEYGLALHNVSQRSVDAIRVFMEMIRLDNCDHLYARRCLLRCYLDRGDGLLARELLEAMLCTGSICSGEDSSAGAIAPVSSSGNIGGRDKTPTLTISSDRSSCCLYSRAFIEHISLLLQEKGSSEAMRDERLMEAYRVNPCTLWIIAHHRLVEQLFTRKFTSALTKPKQDVRVLLRSGSVGDAVAFFEEDLPLWIETEGAVQWCQEWLRRHGCVPPTLPSVFAGPELCPDGVPPTPVVQIDDAHSISAAELETIYSDMLQTAFEVITADLSSR